MRLWPAAFVYKRAVWIHGELPSGIYNDVAVLFLICVRSATVCG